MHQLFSAKNLWLNGFQLLTLKMQRQKRFIELLTVDYRFLSILPPVLWIWHCIDPLYMQAPDVYKAAWKLLKVSLLSLFLIPKFVPYLLTIILLSCSYLLLAFSLLVLTVFSTGCRWNLSSWGFWWPWGARKNSGSKICPWKENTIFWHLFGNANCCDWVCAFCSWS